MAEAQRLSLAAMQQNLALSSSPHQGGPHKFRGDDILSQNPAQFFRAFDLLFEPGNLFVVFAHPQSLPVSRILFDLSPVYRKKQGKSIY